MHAFADWCTAFTSDEVSSIVEVEGKDLAVTVGLRTPKRPHQGFTIVELMAVMACVSLLLTILLPSLSAARSAAYRVISAGNQRTLGHGLVMFAGGSNGRIPPSRVLLEDPLDLAELQRVYEPSFDNFVGVGDNNATDQLTPGDVYRNRFAIDSAMYGWDGLGHLFFGNFVSEPSVYYSPSHRGDHDYERYEDSWIHQDMGILPADHTIYGNYHYIGHLNADRSEIRLEHDAARVLITDGLRTQWDMNHATGLNTLWADCSVHWVSCVSLFNLLPANPRGMDEPPKGRQNDLIRSIFDGYFEQELRKQRAFDTNG